jgi:hypothetical protein
MNQNRVRLYAVAGYDCCIIGVRPESSEIFRQRLNGNALEAFSRSICIAELIG